MFPKARCDLALLVAVLVQLFFEEILCKDAHLWETAHALLYFDIDGTFIVGQVFEVVEFDKMLAVLVESFFEEILHKDACLWETIHALLYFDIDGTIIVGQVFEVVEFDEIGWEVPDLHVHVFCSAMGVLR